MPAKSIFLVIRGMILAREVPIAQNLVPMAFNQDMKAILVGPNVSSDYLLYTMLARRDGLLRLIGSSAHGTRRIGTESLESWLLPLPEEEEQDIIADALHKCDSKIDSLESETALLEELFRALLEELMTGRRSAVALIEKQT